MNIILLSLNILFNCFITSETKAKAILSEEGKGEYYISTTNYINKDKTLILPIIGNYEYLIICKNSNDINPSFYIDGSWCGNDYIKLEPKVDSFIEIEIKNTDCTTLLIAIK